ncbi:MAG: low affinity iron permease family protein [Parachlamydia sp.]|jgi:low affinity Fe/Cu permease|nr:low affinity iron permease family protein [Parachlamydia sp.]
MHHKKLSPLSHFLRWSDRTAGRPLTFVIALLILAVWFAIGLYRGFSNTWLLIITGFATVNASLMVFIIQNTQVRQTKALNIKLDGILQAIKETNELIAIEELEEEELDKLREK